MIIGRAAIQRVVQISFREAFASGFTIERNEEQYLITARHLFEKDWDNGLRTLQDGEVMQIKVFHNEQWKPLNVTIHLHDNLDVDVVVLSFAGNLTERFEIGYSSEDLVLSQDVFFLGFPYTMSTSDNSGVNYGYPYPFVKKATCSTLEEDKGGNILIYLDGHTNPGFSGGPVVYRNLESNELNVAGVIQGYFVHKGEIEFEEEDENGEVTEEKIFYDENAGIIKVQSIQNVRQILEKL